MTDTSAQEAPQTRRRGGLRRLLLGGFVFVVTGAIAFQVVRLDVVSPDMFRDLLPRAQEGGSESAFVALDPIVVNMPAATESTHLRFAAQLEVGGGARDTVASQKPRISDVLNDYLRALEPAQLGERAALMRLRAQMLRRVQVVTGEDAVRDLLITEFVMN